MFEGLAENSFLAASMLDVAFHVTYLPCFCVTSLLNIRQVYTSYSNFNVSYTCYDEIYGAENVRLGGLTRDV
jgi:hypothetical protein